MKIAELRRHADGLGFTPKDSVRWLAPAQLARTGIKVALSEVFADYDDKRELQATFGDGLVQAQDPDAAEFWFDFVADIGDGFDPTYTIAWLLGRDAVDAEQHRLPRGSLLVFGGDEVYPAASARGYHDRTMGPYRAALRPGGTDEPLLVALPGNHDWYDGLTSFLRTFTQGRNIGGWCTTQARSYFAVQLPQRWWLVGLDTQLGTYIDGPQLEYFAEHVSSKLRPGDGVIVCSSTPTWMHTALDDVDAFNTLHWFDRNYIRSRLDPQTGERAPTHASVRLWLTGDSHHYVRYAERLPGDPGGEPMPPDPRRQQMITCGLGGAYLAGTHWVPRELRLPPPTAHLRDRDEQPKCFTRAPTTWPDVRTSRAWSARIAQPWSRFWLPRRNPGFTDLIAGVQVALFLIAAFVFGQAHGRPSIRAVRTADLASVLVYDLEVLVAVIVVFLLPWAFRRLRERAWSPPSTAVIGVLLQVFVALVSLTVFVAVPWPRGWSDLAVLILCAAGAAIIGGGLGSEGFALYIVSARSGQVAHLRMSGQAIEDVKGFLRIRIAPDGDLIVHPLVVPKVCHDWALADEPTSGQVRPVPARTPHVRFAEPPITVARTAEPARECEDEAQVGE